MQGKALASAVVVHFPPEILTFTAQPTFSPAFLSGGSLQVTVTLRGLKQQSGGKRKVGLSPSPPPLPLRLPPFLQRIGGGGWVRTVL